MSYIVRQLQVFVTPSHIHLYTEQLPDVTNSRHDIPVLFGHVVTLSLAHETVHLPVKTIFLSSCELTLDAAGDIDL